MGTDRDRHERRRRLEDLTDRWRTRHDAARPRQPADRPPADPGRELQARNAFPYREVSPAEYAGVHADEMPGFTYDDYAYLDSELDAWLTELGEILRARRAGGARRDARDG